MKSGIYQILNLVNGKMYIGSSNNIERRIYDHGALLLNNRHHSIHLQRAFDKYGNENFDVNILEYCEENILLEKEQYYLNLYLEADKYLTGESDTFIKKGYNICPFAIKGFTGRHRRESIIKQLKSRGLSEIYQVDINGVILNIYDMVTECPDPESNIYKSIRDRTCLKSKKYGYIKATEYNEDYRPIEIKAWNKGISIEYKGELRAVYVFDIYGNKLNYFKSITECAEFYNLECGNICRKINKLPKKILIDSEQSKFLIFDNENCKELELNKNYWTYVFDNIKLCKKHKLIISDCFNNIIGYSTESQLAKLLNVTESSIYGAISRGTAIKSLYVKRNS